jgi:ABC-type uncharacterized transport system permease subunit
MGINVRVAITASFMLSTALAGLAGLLIAPLFSVHSGETMLFSLPPQAPVEAPTQLYILIRATAIGG